MGVKSAVLTGLFLPLLVPLLLMAPPLADGVATKCRHPKSPNEEQTCPEGFDACMTIKCTKGDVDGCTHVKERKRGEFCIDLKSICVGYSLGEMKEGPEGCQLCTTDMCNTGDLVDGGDWDNPDHKPPTPGTSPISITARVTPSPTTTTPPITTTTKKATANPISSTGMASDGSTTEGVTDGTGGGQHFAIVNWLLLIAGSLLVGLISQNAILLR